MRELMRVEFTIKVGDSKLSLFSFEKNSASVLIIQDVSSDSIPVLECLEDGQIKVHSNGENTFTMVSNIGHGDMSSLVSNLSSFHRKCFDRMVFRSQSSVNGGRNRRRQVDNAQTRQPNNENEEDFKQFGSNEHYDDNLDMDQQSQEYWDNL